MNQDQQTIESRRDQEYLALVRHRAEERRNTIRMIRRRQYALENSSYLFNALSIATASYFVIDLAGNYAGLWAYVFGAFLIAVLVMNEAAKRYAIVEGAEGARGWFAVVAVLIAISAWTSYQGGEKFTVEMAVAPPVEHNPAIDSLNTRIAAVDADIATWRRQTWRGKIVTDARRAISRLEETKVALIGQRANLEARDLSRNDKTEGEHETEIRKFGNVFGGVAAVADLLLFACLLFAKNDEQNARRLATNANANNPERERSRERERTNERTPPNAKPAPGPAAMADAVPARVDLAQTEYAQRMARQLAEVREQMQKAQAEVARLRAEKEQHERERAEVEQRERAERERMANAEQQAENVRANAERTNKNTPPAWVAQAKAMRSAGKSYDEIAAELGKAKSTVHKWVNA